MKGSVGKLKMCMNELSKPHLEGLNSNKLLRLVPLGLAYVML